MGKGTVEGEPPSEEPLRKSRQRGGAVVGGALLTAPRSHCVAFASVRTASPATVSGGGEATEGGEDAGSSEGEAGASGWRK